MGYPLRLELHAESLDDTAPDLPIFMRATTNPGGRGHHWVKKMFIDPAPAGKAFNATDIETGEELKYPAGHEKQESLYSNVGLYLHVFQTILI
jgi:hypothetical protein